MGQNVGCLELQDDESRGDEWGFGIFRFFVVFSLNCNKEYNEINFSDLWQIDNLRF